MRDTEAVITPARKMSIVAISVSLILFVGGNGWWFAPVVAAYIGFAAFCERQRKRSARPSEWMFGLTMLTQATFAGCAAVSGGPESPALLWLVVAMVPMAARYGERGTVAGSAFTLLCLVAASLSHGLATFLANPELFAATLSTGISCFGYGLAMRTSEARQRQAAVVDPLTGLLNRSKLGDRFEEVRQLAVARGESVAMLVCDLDHFKTVNDEHGHAAGDAVLVGTALLLRAALAGHELIYRLGGEEFVVILAGADTTSATQGAERVRNAIAGGTPGGVPVTISVGAAVASGPDLAYDALFHAADGALYEAKRRGRDRVVTVQLAGGSSREIGESAGPRTIVAMPEARAA